ncbi:MAG: hypothetical protein L0Y66_04495 [Myxococcaceae bacterium]|nr:hypothetical protein [Myxococcaceae bacterium]MCI0671503.1 hypothetical protein [Myxococcaceae bacterium]
MERKGSGSTAVVTAAEVKAALANRSRVLTAEEERAVRMRHGAGLPALDAPLARASGGNAELEDELLLLEMQLMRGMRARTAAKADAPAAPAPAARGAASKAKIVRALRKKR